MAVKLMKENVTFGTELCLVCTRRVHKSNSKLCCLICSGWAHTKCINNDNESYFCSGCINDNLPFTHLESDDDYYNMFNVANFTKSKLISNSNTHKLNLNPYNRLDENLIDNPDADADANHYDAIIINDYYDSGQLDKILKVATPSDINSIMHININRFMPHADMLYSNLMLLSNKFSIIAITEMFTDHTNENIANITGYDKIIKSRVGKSGGGVAFYFDTDLHLNIKQKPELSCKNQSIMESLFVQVTQDHGKDIILGVIYRPPNTNVNQFLIELELILTKINTENKPCYIMGDYNIDLLNNNNESKCFLNQLFAFGFYPRIDRPTRIRETSATLIDVIFTNVYNTELSSGVWIADVSDHLPIYTILPSKMNLKKIKNQNL